MEARVVRVIYLQSFVGAATAIFLLLLVAFLTSQETDRRGRADAVEQIEGVLSLVNKAIASWADRQKSSTLIKAEDPVLIAEAIRLQEIYSTVGGVERDAHQAGMRRVFELDLHAELIEGYFIVNSDGVSLASSRDANVGTANFFFSSLYHALPTEVGEAYITRPLRSDVPLLGTEQEMVEGRATMFVITPIVETDGVVLYLLIRLNPYRGLFDILERGRFRNTGESYAFDENGYLVSNSRFDDQLRAIGLISEDQDSVFNLRVLDPGQQLQSGQLQSGMLLDGQSDEWPLTKMAEWARRAGYGRDMEGYRDYRGEMVVGAWTWNEVLDIGIATEDDVSEIYSTLNLTNQIIQLSLAFSILLIVALTSIFVSFRKREALRTSLLEDTVEQRTIELGIQTKRAIAAAEEAAKASTAKSAFLANMSHEIRTPLNGVLGMAQILEETELTKRQGEIVTIVRNSADDLLTILNDILDFAKIEAGHLTLEEIPFQLPAELKSVENLWAHQVFEKGLQFNIDFTGVLDGSIVGDPTRLRQVFNNLLSNALKFTEKGSIQVRVNQEMVTGTRIKTRVEVQDTGMGISDKALTSLFEQFTQADSTTTRKYGGTGLGLTICRDLIHEMGGEIDVESTVGEGTTFSFFIESDFVDGSQVARHTQADESPHAIRSYLKDAGLKVLVAEDNATNQQIIEVVLKTGNITPVFANDGVEALAAVEAEEFDLILMDIQMPRMDGIEATAAIQSLPSDKAKIPIIALTANVMREDCEGYIASGMTDVVTKPVEPEVLFKTIVRAMFRKSSDGSFTQESATS